MSDHPGLRYRPDIDGLRALAIVPVLLFHSGLAMPGGYIGVDVFFVISGFLITRIVYGEVSAGTFSYRRFYERRIRRLLPALLLMLGGVTVIALVQFAWFDLPDYGKSLASVVAYVSNFYFDGDTGYFAEAATLKPLLHTWSLAVEEQFYLVAPVTIVLVARHIRPAAHAPLVLAGCAASFAVCIWLTAEHGYAAFYLLPGRAWELGLGGWLALRYSGPPRQRWLAEILGWGGIAAILTACFLYGVETPFPGWRAAVPTIGTVALLAAAEAPGTIVRRLLTARPALFVGRISYSLYLWHWPLLVFANYGHPDHRVARSCAALALAFVLAALSTRIVENPIRARQRLRRPGRLVAAAAGASAALLGLAGLIVATGGLPRRTGQSARLAYLMAHDWKHDRHACHNLSVEMFAAGAFCVRGRAGVAPTFALVGDSHADAISPAVFAAADRLGVAGVQITASDFLPTPARASHGDPAQRQRAGAVLSWLRQHPDIRTLVLTAYWPFEATGESYRRPARLPVRAVYDPSGVPHTAAGLLAELDSLANLFPDRQFLVFDDVPSGAALDLKSYIRSKAYRRPLASIGLPLRQALRQRSQYAPVLAAFAREHPNVRYRPFLVESLCGRILCRMFYDSGTPIFRDGDHLSAAGAQPLAPAVEAKMREVLAPPGARPEPGTAASGG